jgi:hypothetical protein
MSGATRRKLARAASVTTADHIHDPAGKPCRKRMTGADAEELPAMRVESVTPVESVMFS